MIKKRAISLFMAVLLMTSLFGNAFALSNNTLAANPNSISILRASAYLSAYTVALSAKENHRMAIDVSIDGTGVMDKIGVREVCIDQKINGVWSEYTTLYATDHPEFYEYNSQDYLKTISFYGTSGVQYRVTPTVLAKKGSGLDTGTITSYTVTCN